MIWLVVAFLILAGGELVAFVLGPSGFPDSIFRFFHLGQMVLLIVASFFVRAQLAARSAMELSEAAWNRAATLIQIGLVFSFVGDIINSGLIDLRSILKPQVLISIPFFATAHILYIRSYFIQTAFLSSRTIFLWVLWPFCAFALWKAVVDPSNTLIAALSLPYSFMVSLMAISSIRMPMKYGLPGFTVTFGAFLFLLSDALIGWSITREHTRELSQVIWSTYYTAQILILRSLYLDRT
jgi:hypothetical protein